MTIDLYTNASDKKYVTKNITLLASNITCKPSEALDILAPDITINYNAAYVDCNYVYIPDLSRYYYAKVFLEPGNIIKLSCNVDVLMSYAAGIKNAPGMILRNESQPTLVPDKKLPIDPHNFFTQGIDFRATPFTNNPFSDSDRPYILILR